MSSELTLEVVYYNEQLAVCEPLIEPVETDVGGHRPWEIGFAVSIHYNLINVIIINYGDLVDIDFPLDTGSEYLAPNVRLDLYFAGVDFFLIKIQDFQLTDKRTIKCTCTNVCRK